ncbi:MAG TPA: CoA pyrophosphatase [Candidatus Dormibacteraeota bacterium]|nr:CoA pyrophosphatase [Candidatus Dormibacteraeota bacterium]
MGLDHIQTRLAAFRPSVIDEPKVARAAVALVLADAAAGVELLLIQRAIRDDDPWSGHMALPGGRRDPGDADAVATASRETHEEVGVDLRAGAELIGRLDELRAVARHRPLDLVITPVVFALQRPVALRPSPREVESALWVPLSFLASADAEATHVRTLDGVTSEYPAFRYQRYTIWGLTHRILQGFLEVVRDEAVVLG